MGKHGSYDSPPYLPYFRGYKNKTQEPEPDCATKSVDPQPTVQSPSKKIMNRTECINQLDKWYTLMERGGINKQQYEELQQKIMKDMLPMVGLPICLYSLECACIAPRDIN